jgi:hypothetical protein
MVRGFTLTIAASIALATSVRAELTLCNHTSYRIDVADMVYVYARTPPVYGSALLPLNGQADFCIKNCDFDIPNARSCLTSQQAQFSAAKPSDSPKGSVINLAEEADYDDVQARLAGIQRLLVIAGYDDYLIGGAQGAKTKAAIEKFLNESLEPRRSQRLRSSTHWLKSCAIRETAASRGATTPNIR